ncbi:MAG: restriction endonuclease [Alphaproteobacteria bacterium]|nr:restriction endonuclease [Alphaproteobacteria bacterium]
MGKTFDLEEDKFPDLPAMMLATILALKFIGGSASIQELDEQIIEREGITEEEQSYMMPDGRRQKINYYLAWARTYLKRGDAIDNSVRGVWAIKDQGEKIVSLKQTQQIYEQVNAEEKERKKIQRQKSQGPQSLQANNQESQEEAQDHNWQLTLLDTLKEVSPDAFERLAQRLLREAGFVKVEVRGKTGDGGIDGVGVLRVNLVSFQVYFQCKRYKGSVGAKEIRDFRGALQGRADKGLFITTGNFTSQASEEATRDGAIAIDLIDGERLCELLKQFDLGVATEMIEKISIDEKWFKSI